MSKSVFLLVFLIAFLIVESSSSSSPYDQPSNLVGQDNSYFGVSLEVLENLEILTNSVILTEYLRKNQTSLGKIATDLMIISKLYDTGKWPKARELQISSIDSKKALAPLQKVLEFGLAERFPVGMIDELMALLDSSNVVEEIQKSVTILENITLKYNASSNFDHISHAENFKLLFDLPPKLQSFQNLVSNRMLIYVFANATNIILEAQSKSQYQQILDGYAHCEVYRNLENSTDDNGDDALQTCIQKLAKSVENLSSLTSDFNSMLQDSLEAFEILKIVTMPISFKNILSKHSELSTLFNKLQTIQNLIEESRKNEMNETIQTGFENLLVAGLRDIDKSKLENLAHEAQKLVPLNKIIEEYGSLLDSGAVIFSGSSSTSQKPIYSFQQYRGLPNGYISLRDLTLFNKNEFSSSFPIEVAESGIKERFEVVANISESFSPIISNLDGLESVEFILKAVGSVLKSWENTTLAFGENGQIEKFRRNTEHLPNLNKTIFFLGEILGLMKALNSTDYANDFMKIQLEAGVAEEQTAVLHGISTALQTFPGYYKFMMKLKEAFGGEDRNFQNFSRDVYEAAYLELDVGSEDFLVGLDAVEQTINSAVFVKEDVEQLPVLIDKVINVGIDFGKYNLPTSNISGREEDVEGYVTNAVEEHEKMMNIVADVGNISAFSANLGRFEEMQALDKEGKELKTTNTLVKLLEEMKSRKKSVVILTETSAINQLTEPEGEVLEDLKVGIASYREVVQGMGSIEKLKMILDDVAEKDLQLKQKVEWTLRGASLLMLIPTYDETPELNIIQSIPYFNEKSEGLAEWIRRLDRDGCAFNAFEMSHFMDENENDPVYQEASLLRQFLLALSRSSTHDFARLQKALKKLETSLFPLNCAKYPNDEKCHMNLPETSPTRPSIYQILHIRLEHVLAAFATFAVIIITIIHRKRMSESEYPPPRR